MLISILTLIFTVLKNVPYNEFFDTHHVAFENVNHENLTGALILAISAISVFIFLKTIEFILIIYGAVKASNGENYKYPLSIPFFKQ